MFSKDQKTPENSRKLQKTPKTCIKIHNVTVEMVVDTAPIGIIDEPTLAVIQNSTTITLKPPKTHVFTYGTATDLNVFGTFNATLESEF